MSFFGKELALLRKRANITQYQLAKELKLSRSHIFRIESGERKANRDIIEKISHVIKFSNYDLIKLFILSDIDFEINNNKDNFKLCFRLALELKNKGINDKAKFLVEKSMQVFENMIELHALLANLNLLNNDYDGAIKANEETLKYIQNIPNSERTELGITEAEIIHNLGYVYFERALNKKYYKDSLTVKNWYENNKELQSTINELTEEIIIDFKRAIEEIEKALKLESENLHIIDQLARLYYQGADISDNQKSKAEMFKKSIDLYEIIISSEKDLQDFKKQEASIFLSMALAKVFNLKESSRLINTVINYKPLYYLAYYAKSCIYSINGKDNKDFLDISYNSLVKAIKLNIDLKEDIKSELDLYNLRFNKLFKNKFDELYTIEEGKENEKE
ncbi:MAG: helix-turn-helix transcriptional regulator [Candidatus Sericytochromatia bacterium]